MSPGAKRACLGMGVLVGLSLLLLVWSSPEAQRERALEQPAEGPNERSSPPGGTAAAPSSTEWSPILCDLGGELSYTAELRGPDIQAQLGVEQGKIHLPFPMTHGIATGPEGAWEIQVRDGQCEARKLEGQASILGELRSEQGEPVQGVLVRADCELGLQDGPRTVHTLSAWDGSFALDIPTDLQRDEVLCSLSMSYGVRQGGSLTEGTQIDAAAQPYLSLLAPPMTLPLSADPAQACQESAAFRAVFELPDTGELSDLEVKLATIIQAMPDCGVAELDEQERQAWMDWFNAKGDRPSP